eukprot:gene1035-biopygen908
MVINLTDLGGDRFAQVGITFQIREEKSAEAIKKMLPTVRSAILIALSQKGSDELLSRPGKEKLALEILAEVGSVLGVKPNSPKTEEATLSKVEPQFANIAAPSEMVVSSTFGLQIGDVTGFLRICIPYSTLEPIRDVLYATTQGDAVEMDQRWINMLVKEIQSADVTLVAELANAALSVQQLMVLRPGDFIELERPNHVQASVQGVPVLECQFGTHNGKYALRVERSLNSGSPLLGDINMVLDIPVQLTVELGRTRVPIKYILQLAQGSVVELEAMAGGPMDVLINGYLIAQGEVVVVNEKFGIRLTDVVTFA